MKSKHTMEEEVKTLRLQLKLALAHFSQDREGEVKREEQVSLSLPPSLHLPLSSLSPSLLTTSGQSTAPVMTVLELGKMPMNTSRWSPAAPGVRGG